MPKQYPMRASLHLPGAPEAPARAVPDAPDVPAPQEQAVPLTRAERREAERGEQHSRWAQISRRAQLSRLTQTWRLAAVASAILVATVMVDPAAGASPFVPNAVLATDGAGAALRGRTGAAGRSGERTASVDDASTELPDAGEALEAANGALTRAAKLVATEGRSTPTQRAEVLDSSAVLHELVQRANEGDTPAPADPEVAAAVETALQTAATYTGDETVTSDAPVALAVALEQSTSALELLLSGAEPAAVAVEPAPPTPAQVLAAQAAEARADAERLSAYADITSGYANGRLPLDLLSELSWAPGHSLRPDAAAQLERLNIAFRAEFGHDLGITDSYRSFDGQVAARARVGHLAATPGTSNHGWGIAVDLGTEVNRFGTAPHRWMRENATNFGWELPDWARENGSKPEPWHWEFIGAPTS
ncbi:D-alanyl-D-alanine carboxypeptidase family protein [Xylanimonas sp. McL0601]|uniref:M15 family metallopeptidase n=1 Tax=Xylanimonas sp. McL0601 TaxID=3414739 RepID=UPI003CF3D021